MFINSPKKLWEEFLKKIMPKFVGSVFVGILQGICEKSRGEFSKRILGVMLKDLLDNSLKKILQKFLKEYLNLFLKDLSEVSGDVRKMTIGGLSSRNRWSRF